EDNDTYVSGLVAEPDGGAVLVGWSFSPCHCTPPPESYYAERVRADGSLGGSGESPGFVDPDHDCWDEYAEWVGREPNGMISVGGTACTGSDKTFIMRYTRALQRDHGSLLALAFTRDHPTVATTHRGIIVSATIVASHPVQLTASVRATVAAAAARLPRL